MAADHPRSSSVASPNIRFVGHSDQGGKSDGVQVMVHRGHAYIGHTFSNGITIEVRAASFRRLRGPTYICVIADEAAFWPPSDTSANPDTEILATGKNVVIIGGGDTGADCLGTCHRQKARSVKQFEIMPMPPEMRSPKTPWPLWPMQLRTEAAHEEGGTREWSVATTSFVGDSDGHVRQLRATQVGSPPKFEPLPTTDFTIDADLVLIAMGFSGPVRKGMIENTGIELDPRGNILTDSNHMTSMPGIFAAGDMRRGQSLVVWAIAEGRQAAAGVNRYLA